MGSTPAKTSSAAPITMVAERANPPALHPSGDFGAAAEYTPGVFGLALVIAALAAPPNPAPPTAAPPTAAPQKPEPYVFEQTGVMMRLDPRWRVMEEGRAAVKIRLDNGGGLLQIFRGDRQRHLGRAVRKLARAAKRRGWVQIERRWTTLQRFRAAALIFDISGEDAPQSRQLFYLTDTPKGFFIVQFGTAKARFEGDLYRAAAASFRLIAPAR